MVVPPFITSLWLLRADQAMPDWVRVGAYSRVSAGCWRSSGLPLGNYVVPRVGAHQRDGTSGVGPGEVTRNSFFFFDGMGTIRRVG